MQEIRTEFDIDASAERVWSVLSDFPAYEVWNPFLTRLTGKPDAGTRVDVRVKYTLLSLTFKTTVLVAIANRELRWRGTGPSDKIMAAEHYFIIEPISENRVHFIHGEIFTGWLVPIALFLTKRDARIGYSGMNRALKARAEGA